MLIGRPKEWAVWKLFYWKWWTERNQRRNPQNLRLTYSITPLFATFKPTWYKYIGRTYRLWNFVLTLAPLLVVLTYYTSSIWWWLITAVLIPLPFINFVYLLFDIAYKIRVQAHIDSISADKAVETRAGVPGAGKTSSLLFDEKIVADIMWDKICQAYKLFEPYLTEIPFWPQKQREDAEEIVEAYKFYHDQPEDAKTYPCLWTSVPAFVDGMPCNRLTADHLMQRERLPYGSVQVLDEVSLILPQELFRDKPYEIVEMMKFPRHFGDFHMGTTEQSKDSVLVYMRRVTAQNRYMIKQEWVMQPKVLQWIYDRQLNRCEKVTEFKAGYFRTMQKIINHIGYRKYYYFDSGNEEQQVKSKTKTFVLPPYLNVEYDSRAFKNAYRCKNEPLKQNSWEHLRLSKSEINQIFTDELKQRAMSKQQKKNQEEKQKVYKKVSEDEENNN